VADANGTLRTLLVESYDLLIGRLERRFGSPELARDVLHDTYLRLERGDEIRPLSSPFGYLLRIATNIAHDRRRSARRLATVAEIETTFNLVDEYPDPARAAEAKSDFEAIGRAIAKLPPRRREILMASFQENLSSRAIAERFGLSTRTIDLELREARDYCARVLAGRAKK
jgi:RNA polymerase sigma-70 factor (ECF subfamily)